MAEPGDDRKPNLPSSGGSWQERYRRGMRGSMEGVNDAYSILGLLLSGIIVGGGLGLLIDVLAGIHYLFLPVGIVVGVGLGVYVVVIRYGSGSSGKPSR